MEELPAENVEKLIRPLKGMEVFFLSFGLNLFHAGKKFKTLLPDIFLRCAILFWMLMMIHTVFFFSSSLEASQQFKGKLARKIAEVVSFALWMTLYSKKESLSAMIHGILKLGNDAKIFSMKKIMRTVIFSIVFWHTLFCIANFLPAEVHFIHFSYFTSEQFSLPTRFFFYPLLSVYVGFINTLPLLFTALYVFMCQYMYEIYMAYRNNISHSLEVVNRKDFDISAHVNMYEKILGTRKKFERSMSLPVYVTLVIIVLSLFLVTSGIMTKTEKMAFNYIILMQIQGFIALALISHMASKISRCDREVRKLNIELTQKYLDSSENPNLENIASFLIDNSKADFVLTACGFFGLTKNFALAAIGYIATCIIFI